MLRFELMIERGLSVIRDLVEGMPDLAAIMAPLLAARRKLREESSRLHRKVQAIARHDAVCMRLMTIPGVGPVTALAFISTIDVPARFRNSRAVGPALGRHRCSINPAKAIASAAFPCVATP